MERLVLWVLSTIFSTFVLANAKETILSTVLIPDSKEKSLSRQGRSYYDPRYGVRPQYDRLEYARPEYDREYDRPVRCGRCDDRDDYDRSRDRDRYDDDRRVNHRPTYGNRFDKSKNYDNEDDDDRRYNTDRKSGNKNGTEDENDPDKKRYDDKDSRPSGSGRRDKDRNRNDDRDRYSPDYYNRFLQSDPYRRPNERPYYDDVYRERRPLYDRYEDPYARYDGYPGRRQLYDDRYDRGYDDPYGGYGPGVGRGPHDRPWDETYRGQAGWDAGGRGYYFAGGRPDAAPAAAWGRPEYAKPESASGWQNVGYGGGTAGGYRDQLEYRGSLGYGDTAYRQDLGASYGQPSGWHNVGERRPYRDQTGVNQLDNREVYRQPGNRQPNYGQSSFGQGAYGQNTYGQNTYGQNTYGQSQPSSYGQSSTFGQSHQPAGSQSTTTTPQNSYLYQRENEHVTTKDELTTRQPS